MNIIQAVSLFRMVLLFLGGLAVGKGWVTQDQVESFADPGTLTQIVGGLVAIGTAIWGLSRRRPAGAIEDAASLSEVEVIRADRAIADAIPSPKVQPRLPKTPREPVTARPTSGRPVAPPEPMSDR